jgi:hemerythrin
MILVEWDGSLILEVQQIDEHHEHLVSILNDCYSALMRHNHQQELLTIINELRDYTHYHFETERNLMEELAYPGKDHHLAAHETFTGSIAQFRERLQNGESLLAMELLNFLKEWLVDHIQKTDRALAGFLQKHGVS